MRRRLNAKSLIAVCYLFLLTVGVYNTALLPNRTILPADLILLTPPWNHHSDDLLPGFKSVARPAWDPLFQFYPARKFLAESLRMGRTPFWNPSSFSGTPFAADDQSAIYYPPNWLFAVLPLGPAFGWIAALHTFLAGLFFMMYGRRMGWGWAASLTGATAWMLCGVMVVWQMWQVVDAALCWLPLALYFWEGWRRSGRPGQLAGLAMSLGFSALAGHLQFTCYVFMTVLAYGVLRSFDGAASSKEAVRSIGTLILTFALGMGVAAAQLFGTADYLQHTNRNLLALSTLLGTAMPPGQLLMLVAPDIFGGQRDTQLLQASHPFIGQYGQPYYYELTCFCGAAILVLATFGVTSALRTAPEVRRRTLFWVCVALFALLMGCGSPLYALFYYGVPLFKSFHGPGRILVLFDFAAAMLAAEGVQRMVETEPEERRKYAIRIFGGVMLAVLLGYRFAVTSTNRTVAFALTHAEPDGWLTYAMTQLGIAAAEAAAACAVLGFAPRRLAWAATAVVAAESLLFAVGVNSSVPSSLLYPSTPDTQFVSVNLGDGRVWCLGDGSPNYQSRLVPNSAMSLGWRDVAGSDPLELKAYAPISAALDHAQLSSPPAGQPGLVAPVRPLLDRLDVEYIVTPRPLADADLVQAYQGDVYVYRNPAAFGLARFGVTRLPIQTYLPDLIKLVKQDPAAGMVTTSVVYDSAWKVFVDGKRSQARQDSIYLAADVPAGQHTVEFAYDPESIDAGLYIACLSLLIVASLTIFDISSNRKPN